MGRRVGNPRACSTRRKRRRPRRPRRSPSGCGPRTLDEVIGQRHLTSAGTPFRKLIENDAPMSLLLWGPPGTGKTTLAYVVSQVTKRRFVELSAVSAGVKDVRAAVDAARRTLGMSGTQTVLFIDEVHRFSKTQQDALLPGGGEPLGLVHRRHHGEPVLLGGLTAAVPVAAADPAAAVRRRHPRGHRPGARRSHAARPRRHGHARRRRRRASRPAGRRRRPPCAHLPRGGRPGAAERRQHRLPKRWNARWTGPRSATTATATSTTT